MHVTQNIHSLHCCFTGRLQKEQSFFREIHTERTEVINVIQISSIYRYCSSSKPSMKNSAPPQHHLSKPPLQFSVLTQSIFYAKNFATDLHSSSFPLIFPRQKKKSVSFYHIHTCHSPTHGES